MSNYSLRSVIKAHPLALLFLLGCGIVAAQTPSPTPVNPATRPPGEQTQPPTAPPANLQCSCAIHPEAHSPAKFFGRCRFVWKEQVHVLQSQNLDNQILRERLLNLHPVICQQPHE